MRIAELERKYQQYGLDKRTIDYYSQLGLIPCSREDNQKYRVYGEEAEAVLKKIIILRDTGLSAKKIKEALENPSYFSTAMWNKHIDDLKKKLEELKKHYEDMIQYAEDMRDSSSFSLNLVAEIDNPKAIRAITSISARIHRYIASPDKLIELSENLDEDISSFTNFCVVFLKSIEKKMRQGLSPESDEVQLSVSTFIHRIKNNFGTLFYVFFQFFKEIDPTALEIDEEDYPLFLSVFSICANWLRDAKTIDKALDINQFSKKYANEIQQLDQTIGESTVDDLADLIREICDLPAQITPKTIDELQNAFEKGVDSAAVSQAVPEEEINQTKAYGAYICRAIRHYVSNQA